MNDEILKVVSGICNDTNGCLKLSMILVAGLGVLGTIMQHQYTVSDDYKDGKGIKLQPASECMLKRLKPLLKTQITPPYKTKRHRITSAAFY